MAAVIATPAPMAMADGPAEPSRDVSRMGAGPRFTVVLICAIVTSRLLPGRSAFSRNVQHMDTLAGASDYYTVIVLEVLLRKG